MKPILPRLFAVFATLVLASFAFGAAAQDTHVSSNEPTLSQIYQAANSGNVDRADAMINDVLKSHPNSAKAHYVKAELAARLGKADIAKQELATAEKLAPGLPFVKAESAQALRNQLANANASARPAANTRQMGAPPAERPVNDNAPAQRGFPWGTLLIVGAVLLIGMMVLRRRTAAMASGGYGGAYGNTSATPYGQTGYGPGYPPNAGGAVPPGYGPGYPQQQPGMGSTLGRGLATGAAMGAGMLAAEALGRNMFGHGSDNATGHPHVAGGEPSLDQIDEGMRRNLNTDMGGDNFGVSDGGSWDAGGGGGDFGGGDGGGGGDW